METGEKDKVLEKSGADASGRIYIFGPFLLKVFC